MKKIIVVLMSIFLCSCTMQENNMKKQDSVEKEMTIEQQFQEYYKKHKSELTSEIDDFFVQNNFYVVNSNRSSVEKALDNSWVRYNYTGNYPIAYHHNGLDKEANYQINSKNDEIVGELLSTEKGSFSSHYIVAENNELSFYNEIQLKLS